MTGLPRQDIPIGLHRYRPGHLQKHRHRANVGRTNHLDDDSQLMRSVETAFLDKGRHVLSVGEQQARCGFRSNSEAKQQTVTRRHLTSTLAHGGGDVGHDDPGSLIEEGFIRPPPTPPHIPPRATLAYRKNLYDTALHPAVASLCRDNTYGKGHTISAENFFLCGATGDAHYTVPPADGSTAQRLRTAESGWPFLLSNHVPVLAAGGGQLEYNDPERDEYCRNPVVANFDVRQARAYQELTGDYSNDPARMPWEGVGCDGDVTVEEWRALDEDSGVGRSTATSQLEQLQERPLALWQSPHPKTPEKVLSTKQRTHDHEAGDDIRYGNASHQHHCSSAERTQEGVKKQPPRRTARDAWVRDYSPSVNPYKVEPFKGRCGCSDFRLTYHRVQPEARSAMYAPSAAYSSVAQSPLETPNAQQIRRGGRRRFS